MDRHAAQGDHARPEGTARHRDHPACPDPSECALRLVAVCVTQGQPFQPVWGMVHGHHGAEVSAPLSLLVHTKVSVLTSTTLIHLLAADRFGAHRKEDELRVVRVVRERGSAYCKKSGVWSLSATKRSVTTEKSNVRTRPRARCESTTARGGNTSPNTGTRSRGHSRLDTGHSS